jgi:hypothetical protein
MIGNHNILYILQEDFKVSSGVLTEAHHCLCKIIATEGNTASLTLLKKLYSFFK